nr:hypothetical protein [Tanacetum cinerariifolium]
LAHMEDSQGVNVSLDSGFPLNVITRLTPSDSTDSPSLTSVDQDAPSPNNDPFFAIPIPELNYEDSSSRDVIPTNSYKEALKESCWIEAMQEELNEFKRLEV